MGDPSDRQSEPGKARHDPIDYQNRNLRRFGVVGWPSVGSIRPGNSNGQLGHCGNHRDPGSGQTDSRITRRLQQVQANDLSPAASAHAEAVTQIDFADLRIRDDFACRAGFQNSAVV